jgi:hydrogenase maturation protease
LEYVFSWHPVKKTLVIGYGNPLRGDDGVGWRVVDVLNQWALDGVEAIACHQLVPELAEPISRAAQVIFVDAAVDGAPGAVSVSVVSRDSPSVPTSTHHVGPAAVLAYAEDVYGSCPSARLLTVTGAAFGYEEALSPTVVDVLPDVLRQLRILLPPV